MQPSHYSTVFDPSFFGKDPGSRLGQRGDDKKQYQLYGVLKVVSKLDLESGTTAQYLIPGIQLHEVPRVSKLMNYLIH